MNEVKQNRKKNHSNLLFMAIQTLLCLVAFSTMPKEAWTQKRQLVASDTVKRVAYIDHSRLRKEYKAFADLMKKTSKENESRKKMHEETLRTLEGQTAKILKSDSLGGGKNHDKILSQEGIKRNEAEASYQANLKKRFQSRNELLKEYERKITLAIEAVVAEGGFTDVKPLAKEPSETRGRNITDLILKKLN